MKKILIILFITAYYFLQAQDIGVVYYVAPSDHPKTPGNDYNPGTYSEPWASFQKAFDEARPGDTVYFRGGVYFSEGKNYINPARKTGGPIGHSGTREHPIHYFGYPPDLASGDTAILDCNLHKIINPDVNYNGAISIEYAQYLHFRDLKIRNVYLGTKVDAAIGTSYSANLTFERITLHNVGQRGFSITSGFYGNSEDIPDIWEYDTTRIINCDIYDLCDTIGYQPGNAADGFIGCINDDNGMFIFEGCRFWNFTDDGINVFGTGIMKIDNCWFLGTDKWDEEEFHIEQNGVKIGGIHYDLWGIVSTPTKPHGIITNCLGLFLEGGGFATNVQSQYIDYHNVLYNNTTYKCAGGYSDTYYGVDDPEVSEGVDLRGWYRNNISYLSTNITAGGGIPYDVYIRAALLEGLYNESNNTWDYKSGYPTFVPATDIKVTADDFITLDSATLVSLFKAPRGIAGSLPPFPLQLRSSSDLIDAGFDVGLPYKGLAPDIGAFEYGTVSVEIASPSDDSKYIHGDDITIKAKAEDTEGSISKVEFFVNDKEIKLGEGEKKNNQWEYTWADASVGYHSLRAMASNDKGETATSQRIHVLVNPGISNNPDTINHDCYLFPNPNNGHFTLILNEPLAVKSDIHIVSFEGTIKGLKTMFQEEIIKEFDLSTIDPGLYSLKFINSNNYLPCGEPLRFLKL